MNERFVSIAALLIAGVAQAGGPPTSNSVAAATETAEQNSLCTGIEPFFWEIGDKTGPLASGSVGVDSTGAPVLASTKMDTASAAKWLYGIYVVQERGAAANLTAEDINFLEMTSGYTNMGNDDSPAGTCPGTDNPDTVDVCLTRDNPANHLPYNYQNPATIGFFDYDAGHFENHASLYTTLGTVPKTNLGSVVSKVFGPGANYIYTEPLLPGAAYMAPSTFALILQNVVSGALAMNGALGIDPICTYASSTCNALNSPIPEPWHYSIAHWIEDDPQVHGDGAFSAPGGQGFYPWIEASKTYYGLLARAAEGPQRQGFQSVQCGRLIRHAWDTGVQQKGKIPGGRVSTDGQADR
jgi:hypothetical protein